jgi:hypothetical protein
MTPDSLKAYLAFETRPMGAPQDEGF